MVYTLMSYNRGAEIASIQSITTFRLALNISKFFVEVVCEVLTVFDKIHLCYLKKEQYNSGFAIKVMSYSTSCIIMHTIVNT